MPGKTLTVSSGPLSTAEVCAVLERGQGELAGFEEAWPQDISYKATHRKGLPSLAGTKSWEMPRLEVHLTLNSRQVTLAMLTEMLRLAPTVLPTGKVSCWGKFTEEAKYPAEHGFIEAAWDQGAYWLGFRPGEKRSLQQAF